MSILAIIASAFALTGTPAGVPVNCTPNVPLHENGWAWWGSTPQIELAPDICNGLAYLSSDFNGRFAIRQNSPFTNWAGQAGVSALVLLHESSHIDGYHDETDAECRAMSLLPGFLAQYQNHPPGWEMDPGAFADAQDYPSDPEYSIELETAKNYDAMLPPIYHEHSC